LENTRSIDLKNLTQVLSPNFEAIGIKQALGELAVHYEAGFQVSLSVDNASEGLDAKIHLGIFRITEQALLNSLVHGPAKNVNVSLLTDQLGFAVLAVSDDGPGVTTKPVKAGVGTAVIDSWVSALKAKKAIDSVPGHGYQLKVEIPTAV
jgi:signal transduction histidine kinase